MPGRSGAADGVEALEEEAVSRLAVVVHPFDQLLHALGMLVGGVEKLRLAESPGLHAVLNELPVAAARRPSRPWSSQ